MIDETIFEEAQEAARIWAQAMGVSESTRLGFEQGYIHGAHKTRKREAVESFRPPVDEM